MRSSAMEVAIHINPSSFPPEIQEGPSQPASARERPVVVEEPSSLSSNIVSDVENAVVDQTLPQENNQTRADNNDPAGASARLDLQVAARWLEQALPSSFLLCLVFLQQHWVGILVFTWMTLVLFRGNEIIRKQVALKQNRRVLALASTAAVLLLHVAVGYYWFSDEALWRQLLLLPPLNLPNFWQTIWIVAISDTMARYLVMSVKVVVLLSQRQVPGLPFRRQAQALTLIEYTALLYRVMLPAPVWYRFFLDEETYGHFFSSLTTGLYLTFKFTTMFERACSLYAAAVAYVRREVQFGQCATPEEVKLAGDHCTICQENMRQPISLRCKHVFCEECVTEWFERERTCPLCRAVIKTTGVRSFGDGSTGLLLQIF